MKKFSVAAVAALLLCWGGAFADVELFDDEYLEWEGYTDDYGEGTAVDIETHNPLKFVMTLSQTDNEDIWPYAGIGAFIDVKTMETFTGLKISYTSSPSGTILVGIPTTYTFSGESVVYQATLRNGVDINLSSFSAPEWMVEEGYDGPATLADVDKDKIEPSIEFSHENYNKSITVEVSSIILYGVEWNEDPEDPEPTKISNSRTAKSANIAITGFSAGKIGLNVPAAGNYSVAIYGVDGRMLAQTKANLVQGPNTLAISKNLARGVAVVRIQGANAVVVKKISVK